MMYYIPEELNRNEERDAKLSDDHIGDNIFIL